MILWLIGPSAHSEVQTFSAASTAATYLALPAGSRPLALGQAFSAIVGDLNALDWNPAGLSGISDHRFLFTHQNWFQQMTNERLAYAQALPGPAVIALGISYLNFGAIDRWDVDSGGNPLELGTSFDPYALTGQIAFSLPVGTGWAVGAKLQLGYDQIDQSGALNASADVGLLAEVNPGWTWGAVLRHLGAGDQDNLLPMALRVGSRYELPYSFSEQDTFALAGDGEYRVDRTWTLGFGLEYGYADWVQLRLGWTPDLSASPFHPMGLALGAGLKFKPLTLDYALTDQGQLGLTHTLSLQVGF